MGIALRYGHPVLPGALPIAGHVVGLRTRALEMLDEGHRTIGPVFWVNMGFGLWMLFCLGPESYDLYKNKVTTNGRGAYGIFGEGIGSSMIGFDGEPHARVRSAMQPILSHRTIAETRTGALMASVVDQRVESMVRRQRVRVLHETLELTLEVVLRVTGVDVANLAEWKRWYREYVLMAWPLAVELPGFPRYRGKRGMRWLDAEIRALIDRQRRDDAPARGTLLAALVGMRTERGEPLTDREIIDNIRVLYAAGHETTSSALAWCLIELARHPEHWRALRDEVASQRFGAVPTSLDELKPLRFANAFFREVVRYHSPSWYNPRKTTCEVEFGGTRIPEDTLVSISPAHLARSSRHFERPDAFSVERWLDKRDANLTPFELSTFGGGPHFCVGYFLAWQETLQFLVALVHHLAPNGLAPRLVPGSPASPRWVPFGHPHPRARIEFARA